jgi:hypothetical protein
MKWFRLANVVAVVCALRSGLDEGLGFLAHRLDSWSGLVALAVLSFLEKLMKH